MKRSLIRRLLCLSVLLFVSTVQAKPDMVERLEQPLVIDDFQLYDQAGKPFTRQQLLGSWSLIFLGFTSCPDICPMTMSQLEGVRAELGLHFTPEKIPDIIFVAVDPSRDKGVLADYLAYFHPENIGVTGENAELEKLVKSVDGFYRYEKKKADMSYNVVHTAAIAVVNPQAEMVARINPPFGRANTARELMLLIRGHAHD
jgi:protein SCO1/2